MKIVKVGMLLVSVLVISACSRLSQENYAKVEMGMSQQEVEALLGSADECSEPTLGTYSCNWSSGEKSVTVKFAGDNVAFYSKQGF